MDRQFKLRDIRPTVCLRQGRGCLEQLVRVSIAAAAPAAEAKILVKGPQGVGETPLAGLPAGESSHDLYMAELTCPAQVEFTLTVGQEVADVRELSWRPPVHSTVHVVQHSHHDVGYTDLASNVLREHDRMLDEVIDMAEATRDFPVESQFRITVEQAWSIDHFLRRARPGRAARMAELMRSGHVELTALFGNMVSELCGPEALARCVYHAFRLKRELGVPIVSAEHNDVPGFAWGLSHVLAEAGVKMLCPILPNYYAWGGHGLQDFWDEEAIFGEPGPDAFWWESPAGKRVLFYSHRGIGEGHRISIEKVAETLQDLGERGYSRPVLRWPVCGGYRDNSPYVEGYARAIRDWNERWAWPRVVSSTNARFYDEFVQQLPQDLPVHRGELPGQDYPVGATSTAAATALNRNNHSTLPGAEKLACAAQIATDYEYQDAALSDAYEDVLFHDEHTWGHHFPAGPASVASEAEKSVHACRAAALAHDVANVAMGRIADHVRLDGEGVHLVVFNTLSWSRTALVTHALRELPSCALTMCEVPPQEDEQGIGYLTNVDLTYRNHLSPPEDVLAGKFDLIDLDTGENVSFQIDEIESWSETSPHAAQRLGMGMRWPGVKRSLRFVARDVPAVGYKTYRIEPRRSAPRFEKAVKATRTSLENEFYRIEVDPRSGALVSVLDKATGRELIDRDAPHPFGGLVVRDTARHEVGGMSRVKVKRGRAGPVCASIQITGSAPGHPLAHQSVTLTAGLKRIDFAMRILKDPTPLLDCHIAFPFLIDDPRFRYEGALSVLSPIEDYFPGAYSDRIAVQNWVKVAGGNAAVLWSSLDAPIASLGALWPGYTSPAHQLILPPDHMHLPLAPGDLKHGWLYSSVFANNFGTNFSCSQTGDVLLRYAITSVEPDADDACAAAWGWEAVTPLEQLFTSGQMERKGSLPSSQSFLELDGHGVVLLTCKKAEDGQGYVLRLWNPSAEASQATVRMPCLTIESVRRTSLAEEDAPQDVAHTEGGFSLPVGAGGVVTVRVIGQARP